jgi:hypothetical protein
MSIRYPWAAFNGAGNVDFRLNIPTTVSGKAANTSYLTVFWFRTPEFEMASGGVPDATLLADIASGAQSVDTLHTTITPNLTGASGSR